MDRGEPESVVETGTGAAKPLHVVALGASAGGLAAFERFFRAVDRPTGFAFVVVQHLSPEHESILPQLLAAFTRMRVEPVQDGTRPEPDHVYVIPPNATLIFHEGRLRLSGIEPRSTRQPISAFFSSLAEELGPEAVAVVLSGTGSDGAAGLHAVRARGGLTLVQSPSEAQYDSMPRSAVATGDVDMVLPVADMPEMIVREVRRRAAAPRTAPPPGAPADPLEAITEVLRRHTGKEFGAFKRTTLLRRIRRRLTATGIASLTDYLARVEVDGAEAGTLAADLMIGVTRFLRDRPAFEALAEKAFPKLLEFSGEQPVRVWVPGCSTGEEAYSIAMQLAEHAERAGLGERAHFQIFATDINEAALATARVGHYPAAVAGDVPPEWLLRWFTPEDGGYSVAREIRDACIFSIHDVLRDPPFSKIDLISCRNLLIYIDPATQARLLPLFHYALRPSGFLFLGSSETVGDLSGLFDAVDQKHRLFRRAAGASPRVRFPLVASGEPRPRRPAGGEGGDQAQPDEPLRALTAGFLEELATAVALVDARGAARYFAGPVSRFLPTPTGAPSINVLDMARGDLQLELSAALQAASSGVRIQRRLTLEEAAGARHLELTVRPYAPPGGPRDGLLVLLRELEPAAAPGAGGSADERSRQLEGELRVATDRWRRAVQDLESTNEELRSANEELQTMNEELQSSNEELQLSQEELQSVNEELNTVNAELGSKAEEVNALYADLQNLFQATRIATVVLDRELAVTRFTPAATRLFPLAAADVGRPLQDLAAPFAGPSVLADARAVLEDLTPRERIVELRDGSGWHLLRVLPYLSLGRSVEGVVLTFVDVTELKRAEQALRESEGRHRASLEALLDAFGVFRPVLGADGKPVDFEVRYLNAPAERMLGAGSPPGRLRELVTPGSPLLTILSSAFELETVVEHHDAAGVSSVSAGRSYDLRASPLGGEVVVAWRDVTDRTQATQALREADRRKDEFLAMLGHELRNPLAALQTALHLERQGQAAGGTPPSRHLELMRRQLSSLGRLVDDLLDVARISRGKVHLRMAAVDLVDVARAEVAVHEQAAAGRIRLELAAPGAPLWVRGDPERIAQVAGNLIGNACKFTEDGGLVEVLVGAGPDGEPQLTVRDHGIGMSAETVANLFQPFRQAKEGPARARGGLGLGLWLVKGLAELMGASITARSEGLGHGAEFRVAFQPSGPPEARPAPAPAPRSAPRALRILVVDDNADVRDTLVEYLSALRGHEVASAEDAEAGLERAAAFRPQVVFCDLGLPRVSGHEFARRARLGEPLRDAVLVALTGYGTDGDKLRSAQAGFDHHLTKPLDLDELDRFLADLAARGRAAATLQRG